jgi:hypothetical protein
MLVEWGIWLVTLGVAALVCRQCRRMADEARAEASGALAECKRLEAKLKTEVSALEADAQADVAELEERLLNGQYAADREIDELKRACAVLESEIRLRREFAHVCEDCRRRKVASAQPSPQQQQRVQRVVND